MLLLPSHACSQQMVDVGAITLLRSSFLGTSISPLLPSSSSLVSQSVCKLFLKLLLLSGRQPPQCLTHLSLVIPLTTRPAHKYSWKCDFRAIKGIQLSFHLAKYK